MELDVAKVICIIIQFVSSLVVGCLPYFLVSSPRRVAQWEGVLQYVKCFAGGVFMSACLLNLLPTGMEAMNQYFVMRGIDPDYPVFMVIAALGFFIIAGVEQLAHSMIHSAHPHPHPHPDHKHHNGHNGHNGVDNLAHNGSLDHRQTEDHYNHHRYAGDHFTEIDIGHTCPEINGRCNSIEMKSRGDCPGTILPTTSPYPAPAEKHDEAKDMVTAIGGNPLRAFLLLTALSFHTVFDGLAVGLETTQADMWQMFTAIVIHKSLVSISLGIQLFMVYKDQPLKGVLWTLFFASVAPIGLGIGIVLTSGAIDDVARQLANSFLQGIATGTFLYVTFFEILKEEIIDNRGFMRLLVVVLGFVTMGLVKYGSKQIQF